MWKSPPLILNIFCGEKSSPNGPGTDFLCIFCRSRLIITVLHAFWTNPRQGGANMLHHSNLVKTCLYHLLMTIANIFNRSFHGAMNFVLFFSIAKILILPIETSTFIFISSIKFQRDLVCKTKEV